MSSRNGGKKSFGRTLKRLTLCAAFAAAAGVGYNDFGTRTDVTAMVTSVEQTPSGNIIHTDKGVFDNRTALLLQKDAKDVSDIDAALKVGAQAKLNVYGIHGAFAGMSTDDIGLRRNITSVTLFQTPAPPVTATPMQPFPVTAPVAVTPPQPVAPKPEAKLTVPASLINAEGIDKEDYTLPETCSINEDFNSISDQTPRVARDLDIMRRLPITGVPVFNMMKDPANHMHSCEFPADPKQSTSSYKDNYVHIARGTGTSTTFHEYFHAKQDFDEGDVKMFSLTQKDAITANLLKEATAVAYELATRQEAINHGLKMYEPPVIKKTWKEGNITHWQTFTQESPSTNPDNRKAFDDAYQAAFAANAGLDAQARETAALQAGGQAVVTRLLQGKDAQWNDDNVKLVIENINNNPHAFQADPADPGYVATRDHVYAAQGQLPGGLQFVPTIYFGAGADKAIEQAFNQMGFKLEPTQPAAPPSAPRTQLPGPGV